MTPDITHTDTHNHVAASQSARKPNKRPAITRTLIGMTLTLLLALVTLTGIGAMIPFIQTGTPEETGHNLLGWLMVLLLIWHIVLNWRPLVTAMRRITGKQPGNRTAMTRAILDGLLIILLILVTITGEMEAALWWHAGAGLLMVGLMAWHLLLNAKPLLHNARRLVGR